MRDLDTIAAEIRAHNKLSCGFETCESCTNMVPGEGNADAEILFIGEAPGKNEDLHGRPFVGAAGKLLDQLIGSIGLVRDDVFITNVLKSRPPGNRDPLPGEVEHNWPWLDEQIACIEPDLIVLLGRHAMNRFLPNRRISRDHGLARLMNGQVFFPVYHPAAALYTNALKETLMEDFAKIPNLLTRIQATSREELLARSMPQIDGLTDAGDVPADEIDEEERGARMVNAPRELQDDRRTEHAPSEIVEDQLGLF
ncbi:MAG TPA: uracil-DNA glycosylase [Solirubrobacterales bacterium]|jgi:DNA polymerase|nr:uracil-DNA glycosylase [Solirubrobacterales bacterium]